ncbi:MULTISPECIES: hypothetical protein [Serratia]|uniref:Uncharacterized protein n=1 Tax=Serratia quinivorans TaxID=137545 RepID=A0A379YTY4_9GAMM|nr:MULTISPECIES: hypothetical protein [Serratia]RYM60941.1 hypothetical protein BSR03_13420 [Serratia proteamaculans]CAI1754741.1 Uncharacterised protein [Serratia quinivorans]SUI50090.1 Uncharacterised protein [Serratia quinivorans]
MSNFEIIEWLIKDGGHYTREQHISLLQVNFPDADITETKVTSIRQSMTTSRFVKVDVIETKNSGRLVKALAVDPEYKRYSRIRNREPEIVPRAWLNDEPKCVVDCIKRVQWFNQLLAPVTHHRAY